MRAFLTTGLFLLCACALAQEKLPVVQQAMRDELERNMKELKTDGFEKPFFMNYTIEDRTITNVTASFGALTRSTETKNRMAKSVRLLVGDYEFNDESFTPDMSNQQQNNEITLRWMTTTRESGDHCGYRPTMYTAVHRGNSRTTRTFSRKE